MKNQFENGVMAKVVSLSKYDKTNKDTGVVKTKVRFVVEPLDPKVTLPNDSAITVDINQLKTNLNVDVDKPNLDRFRNETLEFDFYQLEEELISGGKCEKEHTLVKNVIHHMSDEQLELQKKMHAMADAGVVVRL